MSKFSLTAQLKLQAPTNTKQVIDQLQSQLNSVTVDIGVRGDQKAVRQLKKIEDETKKVSESAERMGKTFGLSLKRFASFSIATRAVSLFTTRLAAAVDESIDFQRELVKVSQVTGKTLSNLRGLTKTIDNLSTSLGVSSKSLLSVTRILAQAGIKANDLEVALATLARTTLAPTFDDITQTAEGAIAIISQFGEGVGALERQLGAINAVAGQFAVESGDLISVVRRTGGVFKSAGGELEELLGLFTSVRSTTREAAESIATGLRTIFTRIQRPATIQYLREFGVELTDIEGKFVGPYEAVRQLSGALAGLEQGDIRFVQIAEQLGGFRQIGKVIPLLQKFEVAERARQAALEGGDSLTRDAATAQQALAVQIQRVREEFLAFIRSVADTASFQIFVKTTLDLASALISVGEAIKPLIPLLTAFAGFKIAKGIGSFASGIGASLGKNAGGKIHAFARGGLVPGSGNRDTVPAMLSPGEFVIRKSSVSKLGAGTLAAMNENRFTDGGTVFGTTKATKKFNLDQALIEFQEGRLSRSQLSSGFDKETIDAALGTAAAAQRKGPAQLSKTANLKLDKIGGLFLDTERTTDGKEDLNRTLPNIDFKYFPKGTEKLGGSIYAGVLQDKASPSFKETIINTVGAAVKNAAINTMEQLKIDPLDINESRAANQALKKIDMNSIQGHIFEAYISALSGFNLSDPGATFDYYNITAAGRKRLNNIFDPNLPSGLKAIDAKRTLNRNTVNNDNSSIANKIIADAAASSPSGALSKGDFTFTGFAKGGGVTDTVPAMLTPGEYVINKDAAQSIGYSTLNRMNRHGVSGFASGGPVKYYASGTSGKGVSGGGGQLAGLFALSALPGIVQQFTSSTDEATTVLSRMGNAFGNLVTTASSVAIALQAVGISIKGSQLKSLFTRGEGGLGNIINTKIGDFTKNFQSSANRSKIFQAASDFKSSARGKSGFLNPLFGENTRPSFIDKASEKVIPTNLAGKFGNKLGRIAGGSGLLGRGAGLVGRGLIGAGALGGGAIATLAGPIAALAGTVALVNSGFNAFFGYQQEYERAIKNGNVAEAERFGLLKEQAGIIQALNAGLNLFGGESDSLAKAWQGLKEAFGGESVKQIQAQAKSAALLAKYEKDRAKNTKDADEALADFKRGTVDLNTALSARVKNFQSVRSIEESNNNAADAILARRNLSGSAFTGRNILTLGGLFGDSTSERNKKLEDQAKQIREESSNRTAEEFDALRQSIIPLSKAAILAGTTFEDFTKGMKLTSDQSDLLRKDYSNQSKALQENIAYFKALNLGLSTAEANASGALLSLQNAVEGAQTGFNEYNRTISVIQASVTSTASALDPREIESAQGKFVNTLRQFGASEADINKAKATLTGFNEAQLKVGDALRNLQKRTDVNADPNTVLDAFTEELGKLLSGPGKEEVKAVLSQLELTENDVNLIRKGIVSPLRDKIGPAALKAIESGLKVNTVAQKLQSDLINLTKQRIALESEYVQARKRSIDIEVEAAKAIEEFGGRTFTTSDEVNALNRQLNVSLNNAGIGGVGGGSPQDIAAAQQQISNRFASLQRLQNTASRRGGSAFSGAGNLDTDKRPQLQAAQEELINYSKRRIELIKEELEITRKKNALEKSSLEKLLSGDVTSFFTEQAAVGASAALRSGNQSLAGNFSAGTLAAAFKDASENQDLQPQQVQKIATGVLSVLGIRGARSAQILSGNTATEQRLRSEGRQIASVLGQGGQNLANIAQMQVDAQNVIINNAKSNIPGFNRGGTVYASHGMFVPRGTDTVPAMLTPGEFVVNRAAVQRGNNLQLLKAMNGGETGSNTSHMSRGGQVRYYAGGGQVNGAVLSSDIVARLSNVFNRFSENVRSLENMQISVKLDSTNVNVNFNGTGFLSALNETVRSEVLKAVRDQIPNISQNMAGETQINRSVL